MFPPPLIEENVYFPLYILSSFAHRCLSLSLGFLSFFTDLHFCFCSSTILLWLLYVCNIIWNLVGWFLQLCFSFSRLIWLFGVFYISIQIENFCCCCCCSSSLKNAVGHLVGIALTVLIAFPMSSYFSLVWLFVTLLTVACQGPLSIGFSRQDYWDGLPCPPPGDLPDPGTELTFLSSIVR